MDTRLLHPWDFLGKSTRVGCHFLLQGIFLTQGSNPGLPLCRQTLYRLSHQGRRPRFNSWVRKIHWRRDRLPTPVFLGFPCGSAGKEPACNVGDQDLIPGLGRSPGKGKDLPTPVFWLREFRELYSPWGRKESETTEQLSLSLQFSRSVLSDLL